MPIGRTVAALTVAVRGATFGVGPQLVGIRLVQLEVAGPQPLAAASLRDHSICAPHD